MSDVAGARVTPGVVLGRTLSGRCSGFTDYTAMFAAIVVTIVPSIIIYVIFHDRIVKGLTSGALKG